MLVGSRCEFTCDKRLHHVFCNPISSKCECMKNYPVKIGELSISLKARVSYHFDIFHMLRGKVFAKAVQKVSRITFRSQRDPTKSGTVEQTLKSGVLNSSTSESFKLLTKARMRTRAFVFNLHNCSSFKQTS